MSTHVECCNIAHADIYITFSSPATILVEVGNLEFVHPNLSALLTAGIIAHTNHHDTNVAQRRITDNADLVALMLWVISGIQFRHLYRTAFFVFLPVTFLFQVGEHIESYIHKVFFRPYDILVSRAISIVLARFRQFQRHFIFIEVIFDIGTQSQEYRNITVFQFFRHIVNQPFSMGKHLHSLIQTQIQRSVFINCTGITGLQSGHLQRNSLFVKLRDLRLSRVNDTVDTRRQHIVHRLATRIFLNVHH